jgi:hypothetical protein
MFASIPGTLLLMGALRLLLGGFGRRGFWIKHPAATVAHESVETPGTILKEASQRLAALGFVVEEAESSGEGRRLRFSKPKQKHVARFIDNAFTGELTVGPAQGVTPATATVVFRDIVLVESGESERLGNLAGYLLGVGDTLEVKTLPFTMLCGVVLATVNLALWPVPALHGWLAAQQLAFGLGAGGMILIGGYTIVRHPRESHGALLGALGMMAAVAPLFAG